MSDNNNPTANPEVQQSVLHGAAWLLSRLTHHGRGWTTAQPHEPLAVQAVNLAKSEATARGVSVEHASTIQSSHVMAQMQVLGERGVDPNIVLTQSKSPQAAEAEAAESNKDQAEQQHDAAATAANVQVIHGEDALGEGDGFVDEQAPLAQPARPARANPIHPSV
jgi:hypothetical protein